MWSRRQGVVPSDIYQSISQLPPHPLHRLHPQADNPQWTWWILITLTIPWVIFHRLNHPKNPERYSALLSTSFQLKVKLVRFVITHSQAGLNFVINILQSSFSKRPWATPIVTSAQKRAYSIVARTVLDLLFPVVLVLSTPTSTLHFTAFNTGMANFSNPQNLWILGTFCILDMAVQNVLFPVQPTRHWSVLLMSLGCSTTRSGGAAVTVLSQCMHSCWGLGSTLLQLSDQRLPSHSHCWITSTLMLWSAKLLQTTSTTSSED